MEIAIAEPNAVPSVAKRAPQLRPYQFTKQNAAEMARRGAEAAKKRKDAALQQQAEREASANVIPHTERVELVREQIARTREILNGELEPKERAALLLGLDRLMDRERILAGIPSPGAYRPVREKTKRQQFGSGPAPVDAETE